MTIQERFESTTPKRILSLDGGGIRGLIALGFLEKIEDRLRTRYNDEKYLLCQYFDLIGGTSTGAIIAGALAMGLSVSEIKDKYLTLGKSVFDGKEKRLLPFRLLGHKFAKEKLMQYLEDIFEKCTLGDERLKTGFAVVAKRADTGGTWVMTNNPKDKYYDDNKNILLKNLIRASAAAPTYFEPEEIDVDLKGQSAAFVDGGVSMFNNPAFQFFMLATVKGYRVNWNVGEEKLMIVSIGTGSVRHSIGLNEAMGMNKVDIGKTVPEWLLFDANRMGQQILHMLSNSPTRPTKQYFDRLDLSSGDFHKVEGIPALLHYLRYDAPLNEETLRLANMEFLVPKLKGVREMDNPEYCVYLYEIGKEMAKLNVEASHFPLAFDTQS